MRCRVTVSLLVLLVRHSQSVEWPVSYYFSAEKIDLVQGSVQSQQFWVDGANSRYRLDLYDGIIKKYYDYSDNNQTLYLLHYEADKNANPILKCSREQYPMDPDEFLPSLDDYKLTGEETINGKVVKEWTSIYKLPTRKYEDYFYLYEDNIPVKKIYKMMSEEGGLEGHIVINYSKYTTKINKKDVILDQAIVDTCKSFYEDEVSEEFLKHLDPVNSEASADFERYKNHHNKIYGKEEHKMRMSIFQNNWKLVKEHNSKNLSYKLELNSFADRTPEELRHLTNIRTHKPTLGTHLFPYSEEELEEIVKELPREFDWRTEGMVSMVKSQGGCGSCWAFAATASIEGALSLIHGGRNLDLSEQSIVDCAWPYKVYGCDGGYMERAFQYVMDHGISTEEDYGGYIENDGECHIKNVTEKYRIKGYVAVTPMSVNALKAAVYNNGPVAVYLYVTPEMGLYSHGIYYDFTDHGSRINHGVVVVGYGERDGAEYWIVKNSYGQSWGEDGYILISATNNSGNVLYAPYYPLV